MNAQELKEAIIRDARTQELETYVIEKRRQIHQQPETAFEEENTAQLIEQELHKMGYKTQRIAKTGVLATLHSEKKGKTIALRADMDALNMPEEKDVLYRSELPHAKALRLPASPTRLAPPQAA